MLFDTLSHLEESFHFASDQRAYTANFILVKAATQ